jgi:hypothetical protein
VREATGWGHSQLALHLARLVELEYLLVHHGARGQSFVYELAYDGHGQDGTPFLPGLIDVAKLGYDGNLPGFLSHLPGSFRGHSGPIPGGFRGVENDAAAAKERSCGESAPKPPENAHLEPREASSHVDGRRSRTLSSLAARLSPRSE